VLDILIVEDDETGREALVAWMENQGLRARGAATLAEARTLITEGHFDLALLDVQLPENASGLELLPQLTESQTDVVVISGQTTVDDAIAALRLGAVDFLTKPIDMARLHAIVQNQLERSALRNQVQDLRVKLRSFGRFGDMIGASAVMQRVYECISRVAPTTETVFVTGPSGSGKEVVASTIHQQSRRHSRPFVAVNCGAISPTLVESEFFGHERGAFTGADRRRKGVFEQADTGTLFLDEITEMPMDLQVRLLRVLETSKVTRVGGQEEVKVDVRIIAATNRDPQQAVADGKLRSDLYYRLLVFPILLPPLRDREGDVELLADHFLRRLNEEYSASKDLTPGARQQLRAYHWPGNVRELSNTVRRAYIMAAQDIDESHLLLHCEEASRMAEATTNQPAQPAAEHAAGHRSDDPHPAAGPTPHGAERAAADADDAAALPGATTLPLQAGMSIADAERMLIEATLANLDGNKKLAASKLGISLKTLYSRLQIYAATSRTSG
jgi:DNA-binding NtrC family response regulator